MRCKKILIITTIAVFWFSIANLPTISALDSDTSSLTCDFIAGNWDFTETLDHCHGFTGGGDYSMLIRNDCSYATPGGTLSGVWTISGYTISTTFEDPFGLCGLYTWIATVSCNEMHGTISSTKGSSGTLYFQRTSGFPEVVGADFTADLTSGPVPLTVNFTDQSTGDITSWSWDFGDGATSTEQNPSHTYTDAGTYTVSLAVTGPCGSDTETKTDFISVRAGIPGIPLLLLDD
jgi:PKD repeat protein